MLLKILMVLVISSSPKKIENEKSFRFSQNVDYILFIYLNLV
jgi:hypothetical protein